MSNELTTTKALEGEYIEAGEPEQECQFTAANARRQQQAFSAQAAQQNQMDAMRAQQQGLGQAAFGLGGIGALAGGLFGFK
jgi:hypothetical protein